MNNITVYTRNEPYCFYCDEAKKMLKYYGVKYKNIVIGEDIIFVIGPMNEDDTFFMELIKI